MASTITIPSTLSRYKVAVLVLLAIAFLSTLEAGWVGPLTWSLVITAIAAAVAVYLGIRAGDYTGTISTSTLSYYVMGIAFAIVQQLSVDPHVTGPAACALLVQAFEELAEDVGILPAATQGATTPATSAGPPSKPA